MKDPINILLGSDVNYAPYYGVMLTSLFYNNQDCHFDVYMLTDKTWTLQETKNFEKLCGQYDSRFNVFVVNEDKVKDFPQVDHITLPTYYRLQACNILPASIHKILYLDGDMLVLGSIQFLWSINLEGYAFAGAEDMDSVCGDCFRRLDYDSKYGYYNAGVSLYNFDYWREHNISDKLMHLLSERPDIIKWMDQDAVNALLHRHRLCIPLRYNFQVNHLSTRYWNLYSQEYKNIIEGEAQNAVIVHYNGPIKPWTNKYFGYPFCRVWRRYNRKSLWNINIYTSWIDCVKYLIKLVLCPSEMLRRRNAEMIKKYWNYK